jgi:membrane protein
MDKLPAKMNFIKDIYNIWINEKPNQLAAALAYFGIFAFAPVIYFSFRFAGIFINEAAAAERFYTRVEALFGPELAAFIQQSVAAISSVNTGGSFIITAVSLFSLLFAAAGLFRQLKYALNRLWGVPLVKSGKILVVLRQQLFPFLMVISLGLLVVLTTLINVAFAWFGSLLESTIGAGYLLPVINTLALLSTIVLANAFINKILPDVKLAWRDVWLGSVIATVLMAIGGLVIGLYFKYGGVHSAFEAAGAFSVLMIAIYYFAQMILFGAIITRAYAQKYGSMREAS